MVIERLRGLFAEKKNHKADSIHNQLTNIYCNLPESPRKFVDGPSWARIEEEDLRIMPQMDRGYLLAIRNNGNLDVRLLVHTRESVSWIGFSTSQRRVRYCLREDRFYVVYDVLENDEWKMINSSEAEDLDAIKPFISLAERYVLSAGRASSS